MAEDLAELGFEGLNSAAERFHDKVYEHLPSIRRPRDHGHGHGRHNHHHDHQPPVSSSVPPPPAGSPPSSEQMENPRNRRSDRDYRDYGYDEPHYSHAPFHRDNSPPRDGGSWERDYYGRPVSQAGSAGRDRPRERRHSAAVPGPYTTGYPPPPPNPPYMAALPPAPLPAPPAPDAPRYLPPYNYNNGNNNNDADIRMSPYHPQAQAAQPQPASRRARSLSPKRKAKPEKSKHRWDRRADGPATFASSVVGALAGGLAGNQISKGDTFTTIASAVIGAVGATELEKKREKRQMRKAQEDEYWEEEKRGASDGGKGKRKEGDREYRRRDEKGWRDY